MAAAKQSLLPLLGALSPEHQRVAVDVGIVALLLLAFDFFFTYGPGRLLIRRVLSLGMLAPKEAARTTRQAAARLVGCAFLAAVLPLAARVLPDASLRADRLYASNDVSSLCVSITAGYFVYDILLCLLRFGDNGAAFLLHALVCCSVYSFAAFSGRLHYYGAMFLMWECSTPFLYLRWALLKGGAANSWAMAPANYAFLLSFFLCRNVLGPAMSLDFILQTQRDLAHPGPHSFPRHTVWGIYAGAAALNTLNYVWLSQMVRALRVGTRQAKAKYT